MKTLILVIVALAGLLTSGCTVMRTRDYPHGPVVYLDIESSHDLRVRVWDDFRGGPLGGAIVTVPATKSRDVTCTTGWTRTLAVLPEADFADILVEWPVRACYECGHYHWRSFERRIYLRHGITEVTVGVDTRPPI
ncbi:MAG: hypothetical protein HY340_02900 [Candidatus Kerfeldbacteria bacterium]|nr:hypothetical protein [Candidatus Kerfeldbacteria bacterium]